MQTLVFMLALCLQYPGHPESSQKQVPAVEAFTQQGGVATMADTASINGQWFLQPMLASDTAAGKFPVLNIYMASGKFTGNTGCNSMRGLLHKTDTSLVFEQGIIVSTKVNCPGYDEAAFIRNLQRTNRYKIERGVLILMFDATELSRWTRKPDRKLKMNKA